MAETIYIKGAKDEVVGGEPFAEKAVASGRVSPSEPWHRVAIWKLSSGDWYAARFRAGVSPSEPQSVGETKIIWRNREEPLYGGPKDEDEQTSQMISAAMSFFEWSWLAKDMADEVGWSTTVNIDVDASDG